MRQVTRVEVAQDGATPLFMAAQEGHEGCAKLLLEAKAAVDAAENVSGRSAATLAECRIQSLGPLGGKGHDAGSEWKGIFPGS